MKDVHPSVPWINEWLAHAILLELLSSDYSNPNLDVKGIGDIWWLLSKCTDSVTVIKISNPHGLLFNKTKCVQCIEKSKKRWFRVCNVKSK